MLFPALIIFVKTLKVKLVFGICCSKRLKVICFVNNYARYVRNSAGTWRQGTSRKEMSILCKSQIISKRGAEVGIIITGASCVHYTKRAAYKLKGSGQVA